MSHPVNTTVPLHRTGRRRASRIIEQAPGSKNSWVLEVWKLRKPGASGSQKPQKIVEMAGFETRRLAEEALADRIASWMRREGWIQDPPSAGSTSEAPDDSAEPELPEILGAADEADNLTDDLTDEELEALTSPSPAP